MKTNSSMKFLTIIFCFCATTVMAQQYNGIYTTTGEYSSPVSGSMYGENTNAYGNYQTNVYEVGAHYEEIHFGSTSSLLTERGEEPAGLVDLSDGQSQGQGGTQRIRNKQQVSDPPADPLDGPLGDIPWLLMAILAGAFAIFSARKHRAEKRQ